MKAAATGSSALERIRDLKRIPTIPAVLAPPIALSRTTDGAT
jgi:hypothetical protein